MHERILALPEPRAPIPIRNSDDLPPPIVGCKRGRAAADHPDPPPHPNAAEIIHLLNHPDLKAYLAAQSPAEKARKLWGNVFCHKTSQID